LNTRNLEQKTFTDPELEVVVRSVPIVPRIDRVLVATPTWSISSDSTRASSAIRALAPTLEEKQAESNKIASTRVKETLSFALITTFYGRVVHMVNPLQDKDLEEDKIDLEKDRKEEDSSKVVSQVGLED
jgi:hypothetical protein